MKIGLVTDTHFGARGDSPELLLNQQKFLDNIFFPTLDKHKVTQVLHGGDYADRRKYVNYATANFIETSYRQPMREREIVETILVGNHDCYLRHTTDINSVEELNRHASLVSVVKQPTEIEIDGLSILLLPWICDATRERSLELIKSTSASVVYGHLEIQGFQMYRGLPSGEGLDPQMFDKFELVLSGHYHHKSANPPIHYLGAPWPMIWSDYQDPRGFHLLDTETHELTFIENPFSLFARLEYDDEGKPRSYPTDLVRQIQVKDSPYRDAFVKVVVKSKNNPFWFDIVIDALYKANAQDVRVVDDIVVDELFEESDETADIDTLELFKEYIDSLTINCDKDALNKYMHELYHEAIAATQSTSTT
jgi:DNA repair exonuclease SbcCD nuclease subunit